MPFEQSKTMEDMCGCWCDRKDLINEHSLDTRVDQRGTRSFLLERKSPTVRSHFSAVTL